MRIVAGKLKGRAIVAPEGQGTRPTSDRARQAVFNVLEHAAWAEPLALAGQLITGTRVARIERDAVNPSGWQLRTEGAGGARQVYAGFDAVLLAQPAVPAQALLASSAVDTPLTDAMRRGFAAGVTLTDGETMAPAGVEPLTDDGLTVQVTLRQGVYHQIKRMFGVFDAGVNALHRESIGGVALDPALAPGQWRELTAEEVERLRTR